MEGSKRALFVELSVLGIIGYVLFFISTNVNPTLGSIYTLPLVLAIGLALTDYFFGSKTISLVSRNLSWTKAFIWGICGYFAVIAFSQVATMLSTFVPLTELLGLLSSSAPVFSNSPILNFLTFGVLVAYIETYAFFVISLDVLASLVKVKINKEELFNPKMWLILFGLSFLFLLYHVTAKGIANESVLILVFFMAFVSLITLVWTKDARPAIIMHILANSIASTSLLAVVPSLVSISLPLV